MKFAGRGDCPLDSTDKTPILISSVVEIAD